MKIAVSGETPGRDYNLTQIAEYLNQYGVSAIEIWPENIPALEGKETVKRLYKNRNISAAANILRTKNIETACVAFGAAFDKELCSDTYLYTRELIRSIETAVELGASFVNHYLYYLSMTDKADVEKMKKIYSPAIEVAEKNSIYLVLENEAHDSTKNPIEMRHIVEAMGSSNFKTNFDVTNYYQASYEGFPYAYEVLKEYIAYVHIKDGCLNFPEHGHRMETLGEGMSGFLSGEKIQYPVIGTGAVNLDGLIKVLHRDHVTHWCTLEPHTTREYWHQYVKLEIEYLKNRNIN